MSALTKILRFQPCKSLSSLRTQAARTLVFKSGAATTLPLTRSVESSWLFTASRCFSTSHTLGYQVESDTERPEPPASEMPENTPIRSLFVGNVPYTVGTPELKEVFEPFGKIVGVRIKRDEEGFNMGYAHIDFQTVEDATAAYQSAQEEPFFLIDRTLKVQYAERPFRRLPKSVEPMPPSKTLFVGNIPYSVGVSEIQELFEPFGKVLEVRLNSRNGFAHVDFMEEGDAVAVHQSAQENPFSLDDRVLKVGYAKTIVFAPRENNSNTNSPAMPNKTLFVSNIPYSASVDDIEEWFSRYGKLTGVRMRYGADGGHLGFAFVDFVEIEDAKVARESVQEKPVVLINRSLKVEYANRPSRRMPPSNKLFFEDFAGDTNDLREILNKYARFVEQIDFMQPKDENKPYNRGHIIFSTEQIATDVLSELNGTTTDNGLRLTLAYAMKPREHRTNRRDADSLRRGRNF